MLPRIISLLPSATEIICALGARDALVGVSHECDFPLGVERLPHCSATRRPLAKGSRAIDEGVKAILAEALSVYRVDTALLRDLKPDIIVTQAQCEVCAVSEDDLAAALAEWTGGKPEIVSLSPMRLADVWADILRVGEALGRARKADALLTRLTGRVAKILERCEGLGPKRVGFIDWIDPLIMGAEWIPELIRLAGGEPVLGAEGAHAEAVAFETLVEAGPEVLLVAPCGFGIPDALADLPLLAARPGWSSLPAVHQGEVYVADGNHYFNRPGPRLVESLEIMAEILNPAMVDFGHRGLAYGPWPGPTTPRRLN
jgi:iron complex transport system substrate-binding protein